MTVIKFDDVYMQLTEDEMEQIAEAYHGACEAYRERKRKLYANWSEDRIPKGAFVVAPVDWIPAVAEAVLKIQATKVRRRM